MHNIVFIMMDQWRYDAMGCMGKFPVKTPNIDRLAAGGTMFRNTYCTNPVCVPARASLMTGLYSYDHGVYYNDQNFPERLDTLPGRLTANGYYAVHIGKKHIHPEHRAIGFNKLVLKGGDPRKRLMKKRAAGAQTGSWHTPELLNKGYPIQPTGAPLADYEPVVCTGHALHELDLLAERRECRSGGNEPFFMKVSYSRPHSPCNPPEPYFSMYRPEDLPPPAANETEVAGFSRQMKRWYDIWSKLDPERARKHRAQYFGCVTLVDEQIGRILRRLQELRLDENTMIILTADHGDHLSDHHVQQKAFFYDSSARVPFIFNGPGVPAGRQVRENVSHIDLFPTLLDYCDLAMPRRRDPAGRLIYADQREADAMSLLPYFAGDEQPVAPERVIIAENAMYGQRFMLKQGDLKVNYYINPDGQNEFDGFDLADDPDELDNRGRTLARNDLSPAMQQAFDNVMEKSARHAGGHFYFQGRVRPMFT